MRKITAFVAVGLLAACSSGGANKAVRSVFPNYSVAIGSTDGANDSEFRRCLLGWKTTKATRAQVLDAINSQKSASGTTVAIEIGSSSYIKYDFVIAADGQLESSFGARKPYSNELRFLIDQMNNDPSLWGQMKSSESFDENCYFVTINEGANFKTFAFYGLDADTSAGKLVQAAVSEAHQ